MFRGLLVKNSIVAALLLSLVGCASMGGGSSGAQKPSKKMLKGTWQVTNIRFVGHQGLYKADLFDVADSACFKGSEWVFIPNNGAGRFSLTGAGSQCMASSHRILWSFFEPGDGSYQFQFKFVNEKGKPLDAANRGYRLNIDELSTAMTVMRVPTTYQGNPFEVVMTLTRVSDAINL